VEQAVDCASDSNISGNSKACSYQLLDMDRRIRWTPFGFKIRDEKARDTILLKGEFYEIYVIGFFV
jgi:hypothetical protein